MRNPVTVIIALLTTLSAFGQGVGRAVFCNEESDTARLTSILIDNENKASKKSDYVPVFAQAFVGTPYEAGTLVSNDDRHIVVCLDRMDCTTFIETVIALAITESEGRTSWRDFTYNLERIRYRGGNADGFASRLHYITDWAIDNTTKGILREVTDRIGAPVSFSVKSLDYMSSHRDEYPALADPDEYARLKHVEEGFHGHRSAFIKPAAVNKAKLQDGDIIAITTKTPGLDVVHMGIIKMIGTTPHLLHASSVSGKVIIDERPLSDYLRRRKDASGIRVFRLTD